MHLQENDGINQETFVENVYVELSQHKDRPSFAIDVGSSKQYAKVSEIIQKTGTAYPDTDPTGALR